MEDYKNYILSKRHLEKVKELYIHFIIYIIFNVCVVVGSIYLYPGQKFWFFIPIIGGVGLLAHYFNLYHPNLFFDKKWERKKLTKIMKKIKKEEKDFDIKNYRN